MSDFESELDQELHRVLDPVAATPVPARRAVHSRTAARTIAGGAGAALGLKLLTAVAVAAAAVTVAGAATTGSLNPIEWGQQVKQQVETCKSKLADGQHGIGDCVSGFASQHGASVASDARHHGDTNPHGNNGANGGANSGGHGKERTRDKASIPKAG